MISWKIVLSAGEQVLGPPITLTLIGCRVSEPITFDSAVTPQHPRIYSDALIKCVVSGSPLPVVSWRHLGKRMTFRLFTRVLRTTHTRTPVTDPEGRGA